MPDKKLTDSEIIKALSICSNENGICSECPYSDDYTNCNTRIATDTLDLINRQKAENERLCMELDEVIIAKDLLFDEAEALIKKTKAEAVKEFAERLKKKYKPYVILGSEVAEVEIDNLLKEIIGE